jgi:PAS domain S-box-containing protein
MGLKDKNISEKLARITELEREINELKASLQNEKTVNAPEVFQPIFEKAQQTVKEYFTNLNFNPSKGSIEINDERYILVRAAALSNEFFENIQELYKEKTKKESFNIASNFLFDIGHLIGKQDAKKFHQKMDLKDPIEKLSAGPVHFAHSGWAFVDILPESNPSPNENFFLKYHHPYSFEANSWIQSGKKSDEAVCVMNAAYSSGWCEESYGIPLTAVEISCRAKGDEHCTFIMAPPNKIDQLLDKEIKAKKLQQKPPIPYFFERKKIEDKLLQNEALLNYTESISKLGSWEYHLETKDLIWSNELYNMFQIDLSTPTSELFRIYLSRLSKEDIDELDRCTELAKQGNKYTIQHGLTLPDGSKKWIFSTGVPIKDADGKVYKLMGYAQDITERITTEIELDKFFKLSMDMLCLANFEGNFVKVSKIWTSILGYKLEEMVDKPFIEFVHPDDVPQTILEFKNIKVGGLTIGYENRYRCKDGSYRILNWNAAPDNSTDLIYCIVRDVTKEREAEAALKSTLHEKEVLLKEVHHRVKNNMQIISSLLNLQSSLIVDENSLSLYKESQDRIKSIASIHELLYQSSEFGKISFKDYLQKLIPDLIYSYYGHKSQIKYFIDTEETFNIDTSIPLGLLVNEIISNSLKHGLKNDAEDVISVSLKKKDEKFFELQIGDNGTGFNVEDKKDKTESLGLMLIDELSGQLNGHAIKQNTEKGTSYYILFTEN